MTVLTLCIRYCVLILEWTTRLDTSSRTLFVRDSLTHSLREEDVHVTSNVELRNNVRLLLSVDLRNIMSDCYLNIMVSLDCY